MKNIQLLSLLFFYTVCFSQSITVNTTTYTTDQLVNEILINSPCVSANTIHFKSGNLFGSTNSIGYFENTNPNFPFVNGVVLTTGDVSKTGGPNNSILSDGNNSWSGDADLESNLLSQSGITINSINASYIEFDFQPKTPNFNFSFLFASEEYGTSQCNFSDAFAFLLKDITAGGTNVNLAVIPNTSVPISVETIRDVTYNSNCPSANANYFDTFNGSGFGPAINFNGQTIPMIASATGLNTNHVYRIKLVIADGGNNTGYDSAIFLKANSFNIGQNILGLDFTAENNTALCPEDPLPILSAAGLSSGTTFEWKKEGIPFSPAQTGETLDLNTLNPLISSGNHTYSVTYTEPGCTAVTDEISIEIYTEFVVLATIPDIYTCDIGATSYAFDLTKNTTIIKSGIKQGTTTASDLLDDLPSDTEITYYNTLTDATLKTASIGNLHNILSTENGKNIFVRIENPITLCYKIKSFQLKIVPSPTISNIPQDLTLCARNDTEVSPKASFDLTNNINLILGSQDLTYNYITFHSSQVGAIDNTNQINLGSNNITVSDTKKIWVRVQNISDTNCFTTTSFSLTVTPLPQIDKLVDVYVCYEYILPTLINTGTEYWTEPNRTGTQLFAGNSITTSTTIYLYNQFGSCINEKSFDIIVVDLDSVTPVTASHCTTYTLPSLAYGKYYTMSGGTNTAGNIELSPGTKITTAGINTYYVRFENLDEIPSCKIEKSFDITIIPFTALPDYPNQFSCTTYTLPIEPNGGVYYSGPNKGLPLLLPGTIISSNTTIYVYKETGTLPKNCFSEKSFEVFIDLTSISPPADVNSCSSYKLPVLIVGEYRTAVAGGGVQVAAGTVINATTTLWYYVSGQNCTDNLSFTINVNIPPLPEILDSTHCDVYYLPAVAHSGNYFTGPLGTGKTLAVGAPILSTQKIYFYDKATTGPCYVEESFIVTINRSPLVDKKPTEVIQCGTKYVLDDLKNGEYYEFPGGPSPTNPILPPRHIIDSSRTIYVYAAATAPNSCISEYSIDISITYVNKIEDQYACDSFKLPEIIGQGDYYTAPNGPNGTGLKLAPPYAPITSSTTVYVYAEDNNRIICNDEDAFNITIYNTPIIAPITPITRCGSYQLPLYSTPVNHYFTQSGGPGNGNVEKFPGDLITSSTTIYSYAETGSNTTQLCTDEKPMLITIEPKPIPILDVPPICHNFVTGVVTNSLIESGFNSPKYTFEWKKEDGTLVSTSGNFSTNEAGNYTLTVTDTSIFGCSSDPVSFTVIESFNPENISFTTSGWFTENQTIIVNTNSQNGDGSNLLYSLDGSSPQESNTFTNVSPGIHEIIISDSNGCGSTNPIEIKLIYAPKFFTPNGDGFNDTWNVTPLPDLNNVKLYIFDRYGKFLKELSPNGPGWNGNYNGKPMPATDYWFQLFYTENNEPKEFKSHFSLKR